MPINLLIEYLKQGTEYETNKELYTHHNISYPDHIVRGLYTSLALIKIRQLDWFQTELGKVRMNRTDIVYYDDDVNEINACFADYILDHKDEIIEQNPNTTAEWFQIFEQHGLAHNTFHEIEQEDDLFSEKTPPLNNVIPTSIGNDVNNNPNKPCDTLTSNTYSDETQYLFENDKTDVQRLLETNKETIVAGTASISSLVVLGGLAAGILLYMNFK